MDDKIFDLEKYIGDFIVVGPYMQVLWKGNDWNQALMRWGADDSKSIYYWNNIYAKEPGKPLIREGQYRKWDWDLQSMANIDDLGYRISPYVEK